MSDCNKPPFPVLSIICPMAYKGSIDGDEIMMCKHFNNKACMGFATWNLKMDTETLAHWEFRFPCQDRNTAQ